MAAFIRRATRRRSSVRWQERESPTSISGPSNDNPVMTLNFSRDDGGKPEPMKLVVSLEDLERWVNKITSTRDKWRATAKQREEQRKRRGLA